MPARDPHRQRCKHGLPLYGHADIPSHLATVSMLARDRRELAPDQQPVAAYRMRPSKTDPDRCAPLYRRAQAVPKPDLLGNNQGRYLENRTCARCRISMGTTGAPLPILKEGGTHGPRRLCPDCVKFETGIRTVAKWYRDRAATTAWAADVLTDPTAALICCTFLSNRGEIYAVDVVTGAVLLDATDQSRIVEHAKDDFADAAALLRTRRLVSWANRTPLMLWDHGKLTEIPRNDLALVRYAQTSHWLKHLRRRPDYDTTDPRRAVDQLRTWLTRTAAGEHEKGPITTCPYPAGPLDHERCSEPVDTAFGACFEHRREEMLAALVDGAMALK